VKRMKKLSIAVVVITGALLFTGCSRELNDENFVDFWLEAYKGEEDVQKLRDDYGWTAEDMSNYFEELKGDEERADKLIEAVAEKDEDAAFALGRAFYPLDDERFVWVWLNTYDIRDDEEANTAALKEYYLTPDDIGTYMLEHIWDDAWVQNIFQSLGGFTEAGLSFNLDLITFRFASVHEAYTESLQK